MNFNNKPIRICFIAPKAYPLFNPDAKGVFGGAEVDLYLLATEFAKDDKYEVSFITADYGQDETEIIERVRVIKSVDFKKNPLTGAIKVWKALLFADAQIYVHEAASLGTPLIALFCKFRERAFVYRTASQRECDGTYFKKHFFAGSAFRWALCHAACVIVQNQNDKDSLEQTTSVQSEVIPNATHLPDLRECNRDIILWVGRSTPFKRPELFIELAGQFPQEQFVMICQRATGDQDYEALISRAEEAGSLKFITRVPFNEVDSYFQRAKIFVNTSYSEGFPNTFVQACCSATPILSLKVNPDDFLDKSKCGLCADGDWDNFVKMLKMLLSGNKIKKFGNNAFSYAKVHHDIASIVEKYKSLFSELIKRGKTQQ